MLFHHEIEPNCIRQRDYIVAFSSQIDAMLYQKDLADVDQCIFLSTIYWHSGTIKKVLCQCQYLHRYARKLVIIRLFDWHNLCQSWHKLHHYANINAFKENLLKQEIIDLHNLKYD